MVLRRQGNARNHKRVHRICFLLETEFRRGREKRTAVVRQSGPLATLEAMKPELVHRFYARCAGGRQTFREPSTWGGWL